ncbi:gfo/Idh/MocA family oxidoreductase [Paenibacillus pinisoli]|uniref:Gfo/Idh/MocA family oxidoreductase n=1 Tax=Paenibacillus pinisoli TaxID=1276110 RepID=A0A3A6PD73_9BACL|nr:Gfo/Idh/MocA family oxidoreductase [Paenibacillus pinisoli]RJX39452.1 gfo/Idh/MocA family oxidoreductase [Paenibacillus pinisoli]
MTNRNLSIGIIGAGAIGGVHMDTLAKVEGANVTAVADAHLQMAQQRAGQYGIAAVYTDPWALLADESVDVVVIAVPNQFHAPYAIEALKRGKHVLLEKPMAIDSASARSIADEAERSGKVLMIAHQMRWKGLSRAVKEMISRGDLGRIYLAKTGWLRKKGIPGWGSWFTRKEAAGGGPLIDIGVHMLDLSLYLMGNPQPQSVYGSTYAEFGPNREGIGSWGTPDWNGYYNVEDLASALIKLDNGATLSLDVSWAAHAAGLPEEPFLHLMGTKGGISIIGERGTYITHRSNEVAESEIAPYAGEEDRVLMARCFVECVHEGRQPDAGAMAGYTTSRILDAIYESSRTGHEIKLI